MDMNRNEDRKMEQAADVTENVMYVSRHYLSKMKGNVSYLRFASKAAFIPLDCRYCTERTNNKHVLKYLLRCTRWAVVVEVTKIAHMSKSSFYSYQTHHSEE